MTEANFCQWLSWKRSNTHAYQVSAPCIAWFASLSSEEVIIGKSARGYFFHDRHGNAEIHIHTKFHLHALYGVQV